MSNALTVTVEVAGGPPPITIPFVAGMNAQQALEAAFNAVNNTKMFDYGLEYFGQQIGYLVVMMNDTYESFISSSQPFYFWEFLVNGSPVSTGIDNTLLSAGDALRFEFLQFTSKAEPHSTMHAKYKARMR